MSSYLLGQAQNKSNKHSILTVIWGSMSMILVFCFSSGILSSIVIQEQKYINTIDEMIDTNQDIYTYNNSWLWYEFLAEKQYNKPLDHLMKQIKPRVKFFNLFDEKYKKILFKEIYDRNALLITDMIVGIWKKFQNFNLNLEIGEEKKYYTLMGHPINKQTTETRIILLNLYEYFFKLKFFDQGYIYFRINQMIESGVNVRGQLRESYSRQLGASQSSSSEHGAKNNLGVDIGLNYFGRIFFVFSLFLTFSLFTLIIEIIYIVHHLVFI